MFPTFDVPPQHAETVGARKHRKAREEETARRSSTATSQSSGSNRSVRAESHSSSNKKGGFGWFGKSKGVQEIPLKNKPSEPSPPPPPAPVVAPSPQEISSPLVSPISELAPQPSDRRPSQRSNPDLQYQHQQRFHVPPPLATLPPPPSGALPQLPSPSQSSRGTCIIPCPSLILRSAITCIPQRLCVFPKIWEENQCHWTSIARVKTLLCSS